MSKRSNRHRNQSGNRSRRRVVRKQNTLGLWLLLAGVLLAMGVWSLLRIPPDLLRQVGIGSVVLLLVIVLLIAAWFALRYRLTPEERAVRQDQRMELMHMEDTAQAVGVRQIELEDLAYLTKGPKGTEFEYFIAALLESIGVAYDLKRVGGAGDRGIDLRGKDADGLPFVVQCKHFNGHAVTPEQARGFGWAMASSGAYKAWFVTTSTFSSQARDEVVPLTSTGRMVLVDGKLLITFIREHWDALPARWQWRLTGCMVQRDR